MVGELLAALLGALVGGAATGVASWVVTGRVLEHEAQLARQAAREQRDAARESVASTAAMELLVVLARVDEVLPRLAQRPGIYGEASTSVLEVLDVMRRAQVSVLPVLPKELGERYGQLRGLVSNLHAAHATAADGSGDPADWTPNKIGRARNDVESFLRYVQRSVVAVIDGGALPPAVRTPYLRRIDMSVWQAPDEPYYVAEADHSG